MLSKPISKKVTHLLFIDDLKGYAKSRDSLIHCLGVINNAMKCAGLFWNLRKCRYLQIKRGAFVEGNLCTGLHVLYIDLCEIFVFIPKVIKLQYDMLHYIVNLPCSNPTSTVKFYLSGPQK